MQLSMGGCGIHMKTGHNGSVAWQVPAQGVEAQVVSGLAVM